MVDDNFIFKGGKYSGKSYGLVKKINPGYIEWCEQNAPGMLKERKESKKPTTPPSRKEPPPDDEVKENVLKPNLDFLNQKGDSLKLD